MTRFRSALLAGHHVVVLAAAAAFIGDLFLPRGVAGGIPYILIVLLTLWSRRDAAVWATAAACTVLAIVGFVLSPPGSLLAIGLVNRALTVLAIWAAGVLVMRYRRQREQLHQTEARAQAIVDACEDGIITFDHHGRVLSANPAAGRIFGRPPEDIAHRMLHAVIPPADVQGDGQPALHELLRLGDSPHVSGYETVGRRTDGTVFPIEVALSAVELDGRRVFTAVLREITGRRVVEQEMLRMGEEERWRIGHELHEELGQALTGTGLLAKRLARELSANGHPSADDALRIAEALGDADRQAKHLAQALVPVDLDEEGLHVALHRLAHRLEVEYGVRCSVEEHGGGGLRDSIAAAYLYQILRQAALQAIDDEAASWIALSLVTEQGRLCATLEHDGLERTGTEPDYRIIRQWARLIGARLNVFARPEGGAMLTVLLDGDEHAVAPASAEMALS